MKTYFAVGHKEPDSAYGFWFPDVEGCFGAGDTYDAALKDASDALRAHVGFMTEEGVEVPEPRSIDEINADEAVRASHRDQGSFLVGVPLVNPQKAKKRVSFNADAGVVKEVERQIRAYGMTKTDWWLYAAHQVLSGTALEHAKPAKARTGKPRRSKEGNAGRRGRKDQAA